MNNAAKLFKVPTEKEEDNAKLMSSKSIKDIKREIKAQDKMNKEECL